MEKKIGAILVVFVIVLCYCVFVSNNAYINLILICVSFFGAIMAAAYAMEKAEQKEKENIAS